jgi:hypothetical protein
MPSFSETVGLIVALAMGLAFISYLLYARGMDAGFPRRHMLRTVALLWLVVYGVLALLFAVRWLIGTPLVEGSVTMGGLSFATLTPAKWALLVVAIIAVSAAGLWLRATVQSFERTQARPLPPPDAGPDATC